MKYLKKFKEGKKDEYYVQITGDMYDPEESREFFKKDGIINISKQSVEYILNLFKPIPNFTILDLNVGIGWGADYYLNKFRYLHILNFKFYNIELKIRVCEMKDEYFWIGIDPTDRNLVFSETGDKVRKAFLDKGLIIKGSGLIIFKCDQLDGVKELLEDLKII